MTESLLGLLFIIQLALAGAMLWLWRDTQAQLKRQDEKISGSLDDLDLVEFQETVSSLLGELQKAGSSMVKQVDERGKSLEQQTGKARDIEKRLGQRLAALEKQLEKVDRLYRSLEAKVPARPEPVRKTPAAKPASAAPAPPSSPSIQAPAQPLFPASVPGEPAAEPAEILAVGVPAQSAAGRRYSRYAHIHELARQGLSVDQIARQAHLLPGEVELILRLKR